MKSEIVQRVGPMHDPAHPGSILGELYFEPLGISVTDAAKAIGVTRITLSKVLNGRSGVSPEMAIRIGIATNTTPEMWLSMQTAYDLSKARKSTKRRKIKRLVAA